MSGADWAARMTRPAVAGMAGYSARGAATGALHLDANESPWLPAPADASVEGYNRYPAQQPPELMQRLARLYGVHPGQLMAGRGADEAIDVLLRTFVDPGERVVICPPTFGYFATATRIQGGTLVEVPLLNGFAMDESGVMKAAGKAKVVFLCSPNNPTGNSMRREFALELATANPNTLIVVDEAYIEFSDQPSLAGEVADHRNLVVTRTLSKAYGLAGVRMGVAIADPALIAQMLKVLPPYPVARPVERAVLRALGPAAMSAYSDRIETWSRERARMAEALATSPFVAEVHPSDANFLLFRARDVETMLDTLSRADVRIRDFRSKLPDTFRLSIGSPEENDIALRALGVDVASRDDRKAEVFRATSETDIRVDVALDGPASSHVATGNGFFDHMLDAFGKHSGIGLTVVADGDHHIDAHHTVEDAALTLGTALRRALGDKRGIGRYGFTMPMDETQARVAVDLSGRPAFRWSGDFPTDHVGEFPAEMCPHFFQSLAQTLGAAIHIEVEGDNTHHMIEAVFKGVGRALRPALARGGKDTSIPSTKGVL